MFEAFNVIEVDTECITLATLYQLKKQGKCDGQCVANAVKDLGIDPEKQSDKAKARHSTMKEKGLTCIDCHFGIAHHEPDGPGPQELKVVKP